MEAPLVSIGVHYFHREGFSESHLGRELFRPAAKISSDLIQDVEKCLLGALKENLPFISITGAFQHFHNLRQKEGITSEIALYNCLRQSDHPELVYPKLAFMYLKIGFKVPIPVSLDLENFIRDAGGAISYRKVKDFWVGKVFVIKEGRIFLRTLFVDD